MNKSQESTEKMFLSAYEAFSDELFRFCLAKTRNREESLDIVQETFMKTWDHLRQGKKVDMFRGFLYKIARNTIIDRARKKKSLSLDHLAEHHHLDPETTAVSENPLRHADILLALEQVQQIPEHHYEILVLRYIQELTISEIAEYYHESENTVSVRIHRALKVAQKILTL